MVLHEGKKNHFYIIQSMYIEEPVCRRLEALGLNDGTSIQVLFCKRNGAMIIRVRGTRLALGRHISSGIEVKEENADESRD